MYLQILKLAADESQQAVEDALRHYLSTGQAIVLEDLRERVSSAESITLVKEIDVEPPNLSDFTSLLPTFCKDATDDPISANGRLSENAPPQHEVAQSVAQSRPEREPDATVQRTRMPTFRDQFLPMATRAEAEQMNHLDYLSELTTLECQVRREGRIKRLMTRSHLPAGKTGESLDLTRLPMHVRRQLETLRDGTFLDRRENILLFGKPGSGKSHALCALAEQLVLSGRSILFTTCCLPNVTNGTASC